MSGVVCKMKHESDSSLLTGSRLQQNWSRIQPNFDAQPPTKKKVGRVLKPPWPAASAAYALTTLSILFNIKLSWALTFSGPPVLLVG